MESANRSKVAIMALLAATATATMLWFGNGLNPWWPLMWFAALPVLFVALRIPWWVAALTAVAAWLTASLNFWGYFHALGMPFAGWLGIFSGIALVAAAAVLLFRALVLRGAVWTAVIAFPAVWVALEYVRNLKTPHGTAGSIAYTQLKFLAFLQLASITGPWGMSFVLCGFPAALAIALHLRKSAPRQALRVAGVALGVVAAVLIFGAVRLVTAPTQPQVRVGLATSDLPANVNVASRGEAAAQLFQKYAMEARQLRAQGAQVIVLPEKLAVVPDAEDGSADSIFQQVADKSGATLVVGQLHVSGDAKYNRARIYQAGEAALSYDKEHMLPPFESNLTPGAALVTLERPKATWGVAICKDMDFTPLSRRYGREDVGLMLVPGWDFNMDGAWHGHIAVMRGVEDGFSIVRAAKDGFLTVSDNRGRIVAERRSDAAPFSTMVADLPIAHSRTLYLLFGDWFGWVACGLLAFSLLHLLRLTAVPQQKEQPTRNAKYV